MALEGDRIAWLFSWPSEIEVTRDVRVRKYDSFRVACLNKFIICIQTTNGTGPGVRRSKHTLSACHGGVGVI